jgi:hypothetical protein
MVAAPDAARDAVARRAGARLKHPQELVASQHRSVAGVNAIFARLSAVFCRWVALAGWACRVAASKPGRLERCWS